jgi:hypothetical protein
MWTNFPGLGDPNALRQEKEHTIATKHVPNPRIAALSAQLRSDNGGIRAWVVCLEGSEYKKL